MDRLNSCSPLEALDPNLLHLVMALLPDIDIGRMKFTSRALQWMARRITLERAGVSAFISFFDEMKLIAVNAHRFGNIAYQQKIIKFACDAACSVHTAGKALKTANNVQSDYLMTIKTYPPATKHELEYLVTLFKNAINDSANYARDYWVPSGKKKATYISFHVLENGYLRIPGPASKILRLLLIAVQAVKSTVFVIYGTEYETTDHDKDQVFNAFLAHILSTISHSLLCEDHSDKIDESSIDHAHSVHVHTTKGLFVFQVLWCVGDRRTVTNLITPKSG